MGSAYGVKLIYNPFWDDVDYKKEHSLSDKEKLYHIGYEDGYGEGSEYRERLEKLEEENEALRALCAANVRVIKEELRKELEEEKKLEINS